MCALERFPKIGSHILTIDECHTRAVPMYCLYMCCHVQRLLLHELLSIPTIKCNVLCAVLIDIGRCIPKVGRRGRN